MLNMAVLLSGSGRTLDNFHERIVNGMLAAKIQVVVSNVENVLGLEKARKYGYPAFVAKTDDEINRILGGYQVDLVSLAGYLKLFRPDPQLAKKVINIHPALIPSFCGAGYYGHHVHEAVRKRGCMVSGCTVHFADSQYDHGPIILQKAVDLTYEDDPDSIAAKVFAAECEAYPEAINLVDKMGVDFFWKRVAS